MTTEMTLSAPGASVAVALASYGVMAGMDALDAVEAAEGVLKGLCVQEDKARGRRTIRMMGQVPVVDAMVAMGQVILAWDAEQAAQEMVADKEARRAVETAEYDVLDDDEVG